MPQVIRCPHCQKSMQVPDNAAGKTVRCPSCQKPFGVPGAAPQPVAAGVGAGMQAAKPPLPAAPPPQGPASKPSINLAPAPAAGPTKCPQCGSELLEGAIACMDCGYLVTGDASAEPEGPPNLCNNPGCGVANPPGERNCQRCVSPLPTAAGTILHGRYRIEKQLAVGGFGAVYLATDIKNGNTAVAIKDMICADPGEFSIRLNFFRREAEILRSLGVVQIVPRIYDLIEQGQSAHLVMEFIKGQDLLKMMEANNKQPFAIDQVIDWT